MSDTTLSSPCIDIAPIWSVSLTIGGSVGHDCGNVKLRNFSRSFQRGVWHFFATIFARLLYWLSINGHKGQGSPISRRVNHGSSEVTKGQRSPNAIKGRGRCSKVKEGQLRHRKDRERSATNGSMATKQGKLIERSPGTLADILNVHDQLASVRYGSRHSSFNKDTIWIP